MALIRIENLTKTVILITHERQIAEFGSRIVSFLDGRIVSDAPNEEWRVAGVDLADAAAEIASGAA